jgi:hypothetical protein
VKVANPVVGMIVGQETTAGPAGRVAGVVVGRGARRTFRPRETL